MSWELKFEQGASTRAVSNSLKFVFRSFPELSKKLNLLWFLNLDPPENYVKMWLSLGLGWRKKAQYNTTHGQTSGRAAKVRCNNDLTG